MEGIISTYDELSNCLSPFEILCHVVRVQQKVTSATRTAQKNSGFLSHSSNLYRLSHHSETIYNGQGLK